MNLTRPPVEVEVCDFCQREGTLQTCDVCGKRYCLIHEGIVPASYGFTDCCKECARRDDVRTVCVKYTKKLMPIYMARRAALHKLPKHSEADEAEESG